MEGKQNEFSIFRLNWKIMARSPARRALTVLLAVFGGFAALEQAGLHHGRLALEMIVFTEDFRQIKLDGLDIAPEERGFGPSPGIGESKGISGDLHTLGRIAYWMVTGREPSAAEGS